MGATIDSRLLSRARVGDATEVARLIAQGADPNARNALGEGVLACAVRSGSARTWAAARRGGAKPFPDMFGRTPNEERVRRWGAGHRRWAEALEAVERGGAEALEEILTRDGELVLGLDDMGRSLAHYAGMAGNVEAMERLVTRGADEAERDRLGRTPWLELATALAAMRTAFAQDPTPEMEHGLADDLVARQERMIERAGGARMRSARTEIARGR